MKRTILFLFMLLSIIHPASTQEIIQISSSDFGILDSSDIYLNKKKVGLSPCQISFKSDKQYELKTVTKKGKSSVYQVSFFNVKSNEEDKNIPDWFDNPSLLNKKFPEYIVAAKTGSSPNLKIAIEKAKLNGRAELAFQTSANVKFQSDSIVDGNKKIKSYRISTSTNLTGSKMLELNIQKIDKKYRVYVIMGKLKE